MRERMRERGFRADQEIIVTELVPGENLRIFALL